jgi:anti-sigma B factor antagonist
MINLYINERRVGDVTVLDLKGRIRVGGTTVSLHKSIRCLIQEDKRMILLNLTGVTFIDSSGLGELIASKVTLLGKGGEIKLLQPTDSLRALMSATKLLDVFDVYESESEALAAFGTHVREVKKPQLSFV